MARAEALARAVIPAGHLRWLHSQTAATAAAEAAKVLAPAERTILVAAAWLHDIGYHHPAPPTGFHPLDGAELATEAGWPPHIAALIAHHSHARFMAATRGLLSQLTAYRHETGLITDALVYADMTAGPDGARLHVRERLLDVRQRHAGETTARALARRRREPHLIMSVARVDLALLRTGQHPHLGLPVPPGTSPDDDVVDVLALTHATRAPSDIQAALHAASSLHHQSLNSTTTDVIERASRLLTASEPASTPTGTPSLKTHLIT